MVDLRGRTYIGCAEEIFVATGIRLTF